MNLSVRHCWLQGICGAAQIGAMCSPMPDPYPQQSLNSALQLTKQAGDLGSLSPCCVSLRAKAACVLCLSVCASRCSYQQNSGWAGGAAAAVPGRCLWETRHQSCLHQAPGECCTALSHCGCAAALCAGALLSQRLQWHICKGLRSGYEFGDDFLNAGGKF